jgi:putative transposon-encoded protein
MDVRGVYLVHLVYSFFVESAPLEKSIYTMYIQVYSSMVRHMKAIITQIESVVTPSGNSGHVVVSKAWIGKEAIVTLKEDRTKGKKETASKK